LKIKLILSSLISCWFSLFLVFYSHVYASDQIKIVHFAEEANWPPFTLNKFGIATEGLSLALMQAIFSRLEIEVEIELLPQKRMLEYLKRGSKDGATVISINSERSQFLDFSAPLFAKRGYIHYKTDRKNPIEWDTFENLQGLIIGIVEGHNYGEDFARAVKRYNLNIEKLSQERQGFDLLLAERIDCFLCIDLTANQFMKESKFKGKITHAPKSYYGKDYHIAFSKRSNARFLIPRVNKIIQEIRFDGSLNKMLAPYFE
jgi:polar amino acid transport system substrate-binding protein